jgi:hypothetical protein
MTIATILVGTCSAELRSSDSKLEIDLVAGVSVNTFEVCLARC